MCLKTWDGSTGCKEKTDCMQAYEKMTRLLSRFITSVNTFKLSLWSQSAFSNLLQSSMMVIFVIHGPIQCQINDEAGRRMWLQ